MGWVDVGVNITEKPLAFDDVVQRSFEAQVSKLILTGTNVLKSSKAIEWCAKYPQNLYCTAGVHPHYASDVSADVMQQLQHLATHECVKAIGECGLDFNRNFSTKADQLRIFEQQLELAVQSKKPVFLHERDAFDEQIRLLQHYRPQLVGGVAHCFTGNTAQMQAYLDLDLYIGITGWVCDTKRGLDLQAAVKTLPLDRLLLETDSPYLRPKGLPNNRKIDGGSNEPAYLPFIAEQVAQLMGVEIEAIKSQSIINSHTLFSMAL